MAHKTYMAAMNAARKEFKGEWKEKVSIEKVDGLYYVQIKAPISPVAPFEAPAPIPAPIEAPAGWESVETSTEVDQSMHLNSNRLIGQAIAAELAKEKLTPEQDKALTDEAMAIVEKYQREADEAANAQAIAEANKEAVAKGEWVHRSVVEKPTKRVWHIADEMVKKAKDAGLPMPTRSEVQAECVRQGIASGTARTQYQHWFKACREAAAAPIATINKDGTISYPGK